VLSNTNEKSDQYQQLVLRGTQYNPLPSAALAIGNCTGLAVGLDFHASLITPKGTKDPLRCITRSASSLSIRTYQNMLHSKAKINNNNLKLSTQRERAGIKNFVFLFAYDVRGQVRTGTHTYSKYRRITIRTLTSFGIWHLRSLSEELACPKLAMYTSYKLTTVLLYTFIPSQNDKLIQILRPFRTRKQNTLSCLLRKSHTS
jgi:hypothetical protein